MSLTQKYSNSFKILPSNANSTFTSSFRTVSRNKKHSFAMRSTKDFYDLEYKTDRKHKTSHRSQNNSPSFVNSRDTK